MQMSENNRFFSFALDSAHVKFDVWNGPETPNPYSLPETMFDLVIKHALAPPFVNTKSCHHAAFLLQLQPVVPSKRSLLNLKAYNYQVF